MDNYVQMMIHKLIEEDVHEQLSILSCLKKMHTRSEEEAKAWRFKAWDKEIEALIEIGGSYHALHRLLYRRGNTRRQFWRRYRMSKDVFMEILHGVREYDKYLKLKHASSGPQVSHQSISAPLS
jgi:hypothetical protein